MAQLNYPHPPEGCQPGERLLFNALKRLLPDDDYVWFEPTLYGERHSRRPDFVLLGHDLGLVIIEVKDWSLDAILAANRDTFQIALGRNPVTRTNPEKQAEGHYRALSQQLEHYQRTDPAHCGRIGRAVVHECEHSAPEHPAREAKHEQRFYQRSPRPPRQRSADDGEAQRIVGRVAQEVERVGLERAAVRRRARDHLDREHGRVDDQCNPKHPPPARVSLGRFASACALAAIVRHPISFSTNSESDTIYTL